MGEAFQGAGRDDPQVLGLELKTVLAVVGPCSGALDIFPGRDGGRGSDDGDQITLAPHLDPKHAEAALGTVEGDALDRAL